MSSQLQLLHRKQHQSINKIVLQQEHPRSFSHNQINKISKYADEKIILIQLQKSFEKYTGVNDPQKMQNEMDNRQYDDIVVEQKLWKYFKYKVEELDKCNQIRTEKEKVNCWYKIIKNIVYEADKKIRKNENNAEKMQIIIKNKYKESHNSYKEIEKLKYEKQLSKKQMNHKNTNKDKNYICKNQEQKIKIIQENILSLKGELNGHNRQYKKLKMELEKLRNQKKLFLINLLKNGYYLNDGVLYFLQKMAEINYKPTLKDFPPILDTRSKKYLLREYDEIVKKISEIKKEDQLLASRTYRLKYKQKNQLSDLTRQEHFKDIYKGTQNYLIKLLAKQEWKNYQGSTKLPKISQRYFDREIEKRREEEKRRIKTVYSEQLFEKVKKIQFGVKVWATLS